MRSLSTIQLQLSSGNGPEECAYFVTHACPLFLEDARRQGLEITITTTVPYKNTRYHSSITFRIGAADAAALQRFATDWAGTLQWAGTSPFRKLHKRKNWFITCFEVPSATGWLFDIKDVLVATMRSGGPGGQHVNKTETGVRVLHMPTGTMVTATGSRSQLQNKKTALELLQHKLQTLQEQEAAQHRSYTRQQQQDLERGNAIRVFSSRDLGI